MVSSIQQSDVPQPSTRREVNPMARHSLNIKQWIVRDLHQARGFGQPLRAIRKHPRLLAWLLGYICVTLAITALCLGLVGRLDLFGALALLSAFVSAGAFVIKLERYRLRDLVSEQGDRCDVRDAHRDVGGF